jgi:glycosyltransferase involved in cell wall biosynthesis
VDWPLPDTLPMVSIIIPTRDRVALLRTCVLSVLGATRYPDYEIIIVDNGSREQKTADYLASIAKTRACG